MIVNFIVAPEKPLEPIFIHSSCSIVQDIYSSVAPIKYIKSICYVSYPQTYESSRLGCINNKMRLYRLDSSVASKVVFEFASKKFSSFGTSVFVDGMNNSLCSTLNNDNGTFTQVYGDCAKKFNHAICEFVNVEREFRIYEAI